MSIADAITAAPWWVQGYLAIAAVTAVVFWLGYMGSMVCLSGDLGALVLIPLVFLAVLASIVAPFVGMIWPAVLSVAICWAVFAR